MPIPKEEARIRAGMNGQGPDEAAADALPLLSFEDIMAKAASGERSVPVPELGGRVVVRLVRRSEFYEMRRRATDRTTKELDQSNLEARLLEACVVEPSMTAAQVQALRAALPVSAVEVLVNAIMNSSGLTKEAQQEAGATFSEGR